MGDHYSVPSLRQIVSYLLLRVNSQCCFFWTMMVVFPQPYPSSFSCQNLYMYTLIIEVAKKRKHNARHLWTPLLFRYLGLWDIYDSIRVSETALYWSALLRVSHYELMSFDPDNCSLFVLLGLGSAFDTVNHLILMKKLSDWVGISVSVSLLETLYLICLHCPVVSHRAQFWGLCNSPWICLEQIINYYNIIV